MIFIAWTNLVNLKNTFYWERAYFKLEPSEKALSRIIHAEWYYYCWFICSHDKTGYKIFLINLWFKTFCKPVLNSFELLLKLITMLIYTYSFFIIHGFTDGFSTCPSIYSSTIMLKSVLLLIDTTKFIDPFFSVFNFIFQVSLHFQSLHVNQSHNIENVCLSQQ